MSKISEYKPFDTWLIVKPTEAPKTSESGIHFLEKKPIEGTVISIGDKVPIVENGDRVMFGRGSGTPVTVEGQVYHIMREEDVMMVLYDTP